MLGWTSPDRGQDLPVPMSTQTRTMLAWLLWLATLGCCAAGLVVTLAVTRPLRADLLVEGAVYALVFPLGFAAIGLVLGLRRPANPIGWLYAASGLAWSAVVPLGPWVERLIRDHRPLPLAAQVAALVEDLAWGPGGRARHHPAGPAGARRSAARAALAAGGRRRRGRDGAGGGG